MKDLDGQRIIDQSGLEFFKTASTFGALSEEAILFLLSKGKLQALDKGDQVFSSGESAGFFVVVLEGQLGYYREVQQGRLLMREVGFGEELGYVSMIGLLPRQGSACALRKSVILRVDTDLFYQLHLDLPSDFGILMLNLSRELARTICGINDRFVDVATHGIKKSPA
ncbi:Crp/Fnr family transcriptional regulator [Marinobacterium lutimaris]|uniref:Cyclic nucleotide-binding domain-containing protein n=1 Tax=Marinobacterium lutimaris TaxID=568106 RepID=A0A1H6C6N9_9GAMM|nr:cyclic nucleotide-binding domain-containing protein [Marinobacterium lutimaris]SEG68573.1 Cyclic nucleotide-binding domain-containing protein [Marinobacterium lutimaris]